MVANDFRDTSKFSASLEAYGINTLHLDTLICECVELFLVCEAQNFDVSRKSFATTEKHTRGVTKESNSPSPLLMYDEPVFVVFNVYYNTGCSKIMGRNSTFLELYGFTSL